MGEIKFRRTRRAAHRYRWRRRPAGVPARLHVRHGRQQGDRAFDWAQRTSAPACCSTIRVAERWQLPMAPVALARGSAGAGRSWSPAGAGHRSSMGGWLMLAVGRLGPRLVADRSPRLYRLGPQRREGHCRTGRRLRRQLRPEPTPCMPVSSPTTGPVAARRNPHRRQVRLIHGQAMRTCARTSACSLPRLRSDDVLVALVKDGDHRVAQQDIALLL